MDETRYQRGMSTRKDVLGEAHVARAEANKTDFDADFQQLITEYAWGTAWQGTALDRQTRHLITIAMLAALGRENELALHIRATHNTGITAEELKELFLHVAVYAGVPAANTAIAIAKGILADKQLSENQE